MIDVLDAAEAEEFAEEHGKPYRSGTSFGYCHVPVEIMNAGLEPLAIAVLLAFLIDESLDQDTTPEELAERFNVTLPAIEGALGDLMSRRMIDSDGDDWLIFEPEKWEGIE